MKITRILAAACFALVAWLPINVQAQQAQVIASCGAQSLQVNAAPFMASFFMDATGNLCTNASGGGGGGGLSVTDQAAWTNATSAFTPSGGVFNDSATALASGKQGTVRLNANREMHVDCDTGNVMCSLIKSPVPVRGQSAEQTATTNGTAIGAAADLTGKLIVLPYANPENFLDGTITSAMTGTTDTAVTGMGAQGAGVRNYVTGCVISNSHATVGTDVVLKDGSAGTVLWTFPAAPAYGGTSFSFPTPIKTTANTGLFAANITTGSNTKVSCTGYKGI